MQTNLLSARPNNEPEHVHRSVKVYRTLQLIRDAKTIILSIFNHHRCECTHAAHTHILFRWNLSAAAATAAVSSDSCHTEWTCFMHKWAITFAKLRKQNFIYFSGPFEIVHASDFSLTNAHTSAREPHKMWCKQNVTWRDLGIRVALTRLPLNASTFTDQ